MKNINHNLIENIRKKIHGKYKRKVFIKYQDDILISNINDLYRILHIYITIYVVINITFYNH